jgi:hypothetical protein
MSIALSSAPFLAIRDFDHVFEDVCSRLRASCGPVSPYQSRCTIIERFASGFPVFRGWPMGFAASFNIARAALVAAAMRTKLFC